MRRVLLIPIVLFALIAACKRDKDITTTTGTGDKPGPAIVLSGYPMAIGHVWVYDNGDTIRSVSDTTINGIVATKLVKNNGVYKASIYCANMVDGWHIVASNWKNAFIMLIYPIMADDTISSHLFIPDAPVLMAQSPITNEPWTVTFPGMASQNRQWTGYITTVTPAGTFDCVKLFSGSHYEYYSTKGLVKTEDVIFCFTSPCPLPAIKLVYKNF